MVSPKNSKFLDYQEVNHGNGVIIYAVRVFGAKISRDDEVKLGGHQGYASRAAHNRQNYSPVRWNSIW